MSTSFATLLGTVARSRAEIHGPQPEPTAFVGEELDAWRVAYGGRGEAVESLSLCGRTSEPNSDAPTATRPPHAVAKSLF